MVSPVEGTHKAEETEVSELAFIFELCFVMQLIQAAFPHSHKRAVPSFEHDMMILPLSTTSVHEILALSEPLKVLQQKQQKYSR